jgi:uncharacterized protein with HEPN domain
VLHDDVRGRIGDMVAAISKIRTYVKGHDSASFAADGKARDAVVWNLAVLGEAARAIPDDIVDTHRHIPWRKMRALRNVLIHEYFGISDAIVWATVMDDVLPLEEDLQDILQSLRQSDERSIEEW